MWIQLYNMVPNNQAGTALLLWVGHRSVKAKQTKQGCNVNASQAFGQSQLPSLFKSRKSEFCCPMEEIRELFRLEKTAKII